jgi:hypothetical protein
MALVAAIARGGRIQRVGCLSGLGRDPRAASTLLALGLSGFFDRARAVVAGEAV